MAVNLSVQKAYAGSLSKGSLTLTILWSGIQIDNWVNASVISTDSSGNIKTKWQKRLSDYNGSPAIKIGVDNDSGSKVTCYTMIMADVGDSVNVKELGEPEIIVEEDE